jgi:hypothetical protein
MSAEHVLTYSFHQLKHKCKQIVLTTRTPKYSDTEKQRIIHEIDTLDWYHPDDNFANSAHIIELKKKLDDTCDTAHAACAWLMCTLLQANFAGIQDKLTEVERKRVLNENDIHETGMKQWNLARNLQALQKNTTKKLTDISTEMHKQKTEMDTRIGSLEAKTNTTIPKKKRWKRFYSEMPQETHTLPGLLAYPDTS